MHNRDIHDLYGIGGKRNRDIDRDGITGMGLFLLGRIMQRIIDDLRGIRDCNLHGDVRSIRHLLRASLHVRVE